MSDTNKRIETSWSQKIQTVLLKRVFLITLTTVSFVLAGKPYVSLVWRQGPGPVYGKHLSVRVPLCKDIQK